MLLGYARVSKGDDQTNALQVRALRAAGSKAATGWGRPPTPKGWRSHPAPPAPSPAPAGAQRLPHTCDLS